MKREFQRSEKEKEGVPKKINRLELREEHKSKAELQERVEDQNHNIQ